MALTKLGTAGGSIIDMSTWDSTDQLIELLPLFNEEQLETAEIQVLDDETTGLIVSGITFSGEPVSFTLRLESNSRHLQITGPSSWFGMFSPEVDIHQRSIEIEDDGNLHLLISNSVIREEEAWVVLESPSQLTFGLQEDALTSAFPNHESITGFSDGEWVELRHQAETWARLPVEDGIYSGPIPNEIDHLVATAIGHEDGIATPVNEPEWVEVGEEGWIRVQLATETGQALAGILFRDAVPYTIPTGGGRIPVGPGIADTWIYAGPAFEARLWPDLSVTGSIELEAFLRPVIMDSWLLQLGVKGWPDRTEPRSSEELAAALTGTGIAFSVVVAEDEIATASVPTHLSHTFVMQGGSQASTDSGSPFAWPWTATIKRPAHGATPWSGLDSIDLLASLSKNGTRYTVVDPEWVAAAPPHWQWDPHPTALQIQSLQDLDVVIDLADQSFPIRVVGPLTWIDQPNGAETTETEIMARFLHGSPVASNGPLISLRVNGAAPGDTINTEPIVHNTALESAFLDPLSINIEVQAPNWIPIDGIAIIGPGGETLESWTIDPNSSASFSIETNVPRRDWIAAICWGESANPPLQDLPAWAFSGIVWVDRP